MSNSSVKITIEQLHIKFSQYSFFDIGVILVKNIDAIIFKTNQQKDELVNFHTYMPGGINCIIFGQAILFVDWFDENDIIILDNYNKIMWTNNFKFYDEYNEFKKIIKSHEFYNEGDFAFFNICDICNQEFGKIISNKLNCFDASGLVYKDFIRKKNEKIIKSIIV